MASSSKCRKTTTITNLPNDLVGEILQMAPTTSLRSMRSTCKKWNALSKTHSFAKALASKQQFLGFMVMDSRVCSLTCNLQGIRDNGDFVAPSIKQVSNIPDHIEISKVFYCEGLLLCVVEDNPNLLLWNPYLGQTRWVRSMKKFDILSDTYALGYDNINQNHKILRFLDDFRYSRGRRYELYSFKSNSWNVLNVANWDVWSRPRSSMSLKGNTYFLIQTRVTHTSEEELEDEEEDDLIEFENSLVCFDFTTERCGPCLPLPSNSYDGEVVTLSCVKQDKLAVLSNRWKETNALEIFVTDKINPNVVSWSKFLSLDITQLNCFPGNFDVGSFFVDEEKKVAVVFYVEGYNMKACYDTAYIVSEDGYFRTVDVGEAGDECCLPLVCSSYVPSMVQLKFNQPCTYMKPRLRNRTTDCKKCGQVGHNSLTCRRRKVSRSRGRNMEE